MLSTYRELFTYFLDGIKKTYTGVVHPNIFVRLFNEWGMLEWTARNMSMQEGVEMTQKQIDDLQTLLYNDVIPRVTNNTVLLSSLTKTYRRLGNILVKVNYDTKRCDPCKKKGMSDWLPVHLQRVDQKAYNINSPFRSPDVDMIYYQHIENKLIFNTGGKANVVTANIEYYRYPSAMVYMDLNDTNAWNTTVFTDLNTEQKKEVLDTCIRLYLERVKDERYKSILNEKNISEVNKI